MINNKEIKKDIEKQVYRVFSKYFEEPYFSSNKSVEVVCCWFWKWVYKIKALPCTLQYLYQRIIRGFDDLDKWNAAWYIARKAAPVLKAWRNSPMHGSALKWHREDRHGNIIELSVEEVYARSKEEDWEGPNAFTMEEWQAILDDIIFAFQWQIDFDSIDSTVNDKEYKQGMKRQKRGLKLFAIYFNSLWD
ncbi:MAG: hypothetical protein EBU90_20645 [Proteobacteria bacterium]|nr:hypothetical protein [Pseudomonadota bacterium]NBP15460.1 hypothetical protein [bacterium]